MNDFKEAILTDVVRQKINVTKTYMPHFGKYVEKLKRLWKSAWVTNNGEYVKQLEDRLRRYFGINNIVLVANGTLALMIAYKLLKLKEEVITTPFSFIATVNSLIWENLTPIFADIDRETLTINPEKIERKITDRTSAILAVHVFGNPCNIESIQEIARKYNLKVIYDAAHAFGVRYHDRSIVEYGDVSILSFHATKLFHSVEGGALIVKDDELYREARRMITFGYENGVIKGIGINAKMNELEAAMGLCVLDDIEKILCKRKILYDIYMNELCGYLSFPKYRIWSTRNYSYFPVLFEHEGKLLEVMSALALENIYPRRYFYPSADTLKYIEPKQFCPISRSISKRILCLPMYNELDEDTQMKIIRIIKENL